MDTAISFLFFTGLVAVVAWWRTHNDDQETSTGYFLAGRSLSWFVVAGSLLLTNLSTEQLVGLNGGAYRNGMIVMARKMTAISTMESVNPTPLKTLLRVGVGRLASHA